jgi:hypothetical protein
MVDSSTGVENNQTAEVSTRKKQNRARSQRTIVTRDVRPA